MNRQIQYSATDKMSDLVSNNYRILLVMSRFGIKLGFGDKTISEVCEDTQVDTSTFLAVTNMVLADDEAPEYTGYGLSPESLLTYLHNSHDYFLYFRLPKIRRDLVEVLEKPEDELTKAVVKYFDEYVDEVRNHMMYEEKTVFPYVRALLSGVREGKYNISIFYKRHDQVESRLKEFKQILIKYYPSRSTNELNSVLFDIFNCEHDLKSHNAVENHLFVPLIRTLEKQTGKKI